MQIREHLFLSIVFRSEHRKFPIWAENIFCSHTVVSGTLKKINFISSQKTETADIRSHYYSKREQ